MTNCPNCGARIIPSHVGTLVCDYCGSFIGVGGIPVEHKDDMVTIPLNLPKEHAEWVIDCLKQNKVRLLLQAQCTGT